jgi:hypothetical protein
MIYQNSVAVPSNPLTDFVNESAGDSTAFKGLLLAPELPVSAMTGTYPKITVAKGELGRAANRRREPGTNFNRWQSSIDSGSLTLKQIGEEASIPDEIAMQWDDYFDIEALGAAEGLERLRRGHEMEVAAALMNASTFTATNSLVAYQIANKATINFPGDVLAIIRRLKAKGTNPDTIVIPGVIYDVLIQSTLLQNFLVGSLGAGVNVNENTIQRGFAVNGITSVIVTDSYVNQSDTGGDTLTSIWSDDYVAVAKIGSGPLRNGGALRTAFYDKAGPLFMASQYRDEKVKSNIIRDEMISNVIVASTKAAELITTQA